MATYYVDPENGSDSNNGTSEATPWRLIPGQTGANSVTTGDIINIKNGTTSTGGTITPGANNTTYRGYGVAGNKLVMRLPGKSPRDVKYVEVVRTAGTHEGMWRLDMTNAGTSIGINVANVRSGVTIEDAHIFSNSQSGNLVNVGTSIATSSNGGFTIRRSFIEGSGGVGLNAYKFDITAEYLKVHNTLADCIKITATTTNSTRTGSTDTFNYLDLKYCNNDWQGKPSGLGGGDLLQLVADNAGSGYYEGKFSLTNSSMWKGSQTSTAEGKQALIFHDGLNGFTVRNLNIFGDNPEAQTSIMVGCLRGNVLLENIHFSGYNSTLSTIRQRSGNTPIGTQLLATGATLTLRNISSELISTGDSFFNAAENIETLEMDGTLTIENCTIMDNVTPTLSYRADVSLTGGNTTYGTGFKLNLRNNIFNTNNVKLRLPTGTAGDADYSIKNNWFKPGYSFYIGSTEYTTKTLFEAAHNAATSNLDGNLEINYTTLLPSSSTSPQVAAGTQVTYKMDAQGTQRYNPPCIGAFEFIRDRGTR